MSEELKACPHCGVHYFIHEIDDYYYCSKCRIKVPKDKYNIRPIEDELLEALEKLIAVYGLSNTNDDTDEMNFARAIVAKAKREL